MNSLLAGVLSQAGVDAEVFHGSTRNPAVLNGVVPGARAVALWEELRNHFGATGYWPIIRGDASDELEEFPCNPTATLAQSPRGDVEQLLASRLAERIELYADLADGVSPSMPLLEFVARVDASGANYCDGKAEPPRPWPVELQSEVETELAIHSVTDYKAGRPVAQVRLALLQISRPWEAPAYLGFGGWNDSPMPELQVAMLREWNRSHGAVPIAITGDVLECVVDRPPQTEVEAMDLAAKQWIFCDDIVSQGTQSVRELAIEIWRSRRWFFWWD